MHVVFELIRLLLSESKCVDFINKTYCSGAKFSIVMRGMHHPVLTPLRSHLAFWFCCTKKKRKLFSPRFEPYSMHLITHHIGRILFALPFLGFGISHLMNAQDMSAMVPEELPGSGALYVYITGALEIIAAICILIKKFDYEAALGLATLMLLFVLLIHVPSFASGPVAIANALKDLALAGAALYYAGTRMK